MKKKKIRQWNWQQEKKSKKSIEIYSVAPILKQNDKRGFNVIVYLLLVIFQVFRFRVFQRLFVNIWEFQNDFQGKIKNWHF